VACATYQSSYGKVANAKPSEAGKSDATCDFPSNITGAGVPNQLYLTVNPQDAIKAYNAFLNFKDVVKASR